MTYREAMREAQRRYFEWLIRTTPSKREAARVAGLHRATLYKQLARLGIEKPKRSRFPAGATRQAGWGLRLV